jgi:hypothetical protein
MKKGWFAFHLPGYREHPTPGTYSMFSYEGLPPVQPSLLEDFRWLESMPAIDGSLAEGTYPDGSKPDLGKLLNIVGHLGITLPRSFSTFIKSIDLQRRIQSCTDCYLDVADRTVKTRGPLDGYLVHFLSDSQWCCHWYLHVSLSGEHFVAVSEDPYGFNIPDAEGDDIPTCRRDEIDLEREQIWFCSPSFMEFIYRFWLENEIWFAGFEARPLTEEQRLYVGHYLKL